jgi:uncharacterized protein (TIRG00374 family)
MTYIRWAVNIIVVAGVVLAARKYLNGGEVAEALKTFNWIYAVPIILMSCLYLVLKAYRFVVLHRPVTDAPAWTIMKAYMGGQPAALIPGGVAARAAMMSEAGVPVSHSSGPIIYSSLLDQSSFIVSALVAALWVEQARVPAAIVLGVVALLALMLGIPALRLLVTRTLLWISRRFRGEQFMLDFMKALGEISTPKVILGGFLLTALAYLLTIGILDLSLRGMGLSVPYATQFLAYTLPTMLGRLVPIPAGLGVTEAGMTGYLAASGVDVDAAAAATAIFRIGSVMWQAVFGGLVYFIFWRGGKERERAVAAAGPAEKQVDGAVAQRR